MTKIHTRITVLLPMLFLASCSNQFFYKSCPGGFAGKESLLEKIESAEVFKGTQYYITRHTLDNGLNILILEKPAMPVVSVQVWYKVGSINETDGLKGMAHLFEHMMFRGSDNFGPEEHSRLIKEAGGSCNAYTSDETTVYHQTVPADKIGLVLKLEADRMASLKLNKDILNTERKVVMEEYRLRIDNNPIGSIEKEIRSFLFSGHPYEFGPIGKMADISSFSIEDCQDFFDSFYVPNNALLVVAGDVRTEEVIEMAESEFGPIEPGQIKTEPELLLDKSQVEPGKKAKTRLPIPVTVVALYTDGEQSQDSIALKVLTFCLAKGRSSRLWKTLVRENKLAEFFVGIDILGRDNGAVFLAGAHLPFLSGKIEKKIWQELEKIKAEGLDESEFLKARNQLASQMMFQRYYASSLAGGIGYSEVVKGDHRLLYQMPEKFESLTQDDIIRVANKYFTKDNVRVIYFEPERGMFLADIAGFIKSIFH